MLLEEATIKNIDSTIYFEDEGRVFITSDFWSENSVSMYFKNIREMIGLCPKYINDQNFLYITVSKEEILISARIKGVDKVYKQMNNLAFQEENILSYESAGETKHHFKFNGVDIFQVDSSLFTDGQIFICGKQGESIQKCTVSQMQSKAWSTNAGANGISISSVTIDNTEMLKLHSTGTNEAVVFQETNIEKTYATLSFDYMGTGKVFVNNEFIDSFSSENISRKSYHFPRVGSVNPRIEFRTSDTLYVSKVQLEEKTYETAYIPNYETELAAVREGTTLSYPNKDAFLPTEGSMYLKITPQSTLQNHTLFYTGSNEFSLICRDYNIVWQALGQSISVPLAIEKKSSAEIFITWSSYEISLTVNGVKKTASSTTNAEHPIEKLIFADGGLSNTEPIVLEEWALFQHEFSFDLDIEDYLKESSMHSLFDGGINGSNVSWVEIPVAPNDHSPILIEKGDGQSLQKVSFFDSDTGDYRTWNEESFVYDGRSDYVSLTFSNINEMFADMSIVTESGEKIGSPYHMDGKKLYFSLSEYEKILYRNDLLKAVYQVNDSYTIDYNIKAVDGLRIDFAKHDGTDRFVYQEGNRFGEPVKLATMIEMNPIYNQNHTGFLYVSKTKNPTEDFRITATPDRLKADGFSKATIVIEPLDYQGNFLSHSNLNVKADKGFVSRYIDKASAEVQKRSGQHLYQYTAPYIYSKEESETVKDYIWIVDEDNNIGICYVILLGPVESAHPLQITAAEKALLSNKTTLMNSVIMYESLESREDAELFKILDLNNDGKVTLDEIDVLSKNERDFELSAIVQKLEKWRGDERSASTQGLN